MPRRNRHHARSHPRSRPPRRLACRAALAHLGAHECRVPIMNADVSIAAALFAGVLSFLSPCVLPLVPPYLVYLAGASLERFGNAEPEPAVRAETVYAA